LAVVLDDLDGGSVQMVVLSVTGWREETTMSSRQAGRRARTGLRAAYWLTPVIGLMFVAGCGSPAQPPRPAPSPAPTSIVPTSPAPPPAAAAQLKEFGPLVITDSELPGYTRGAPLAAPEGKPGITVPFKGRDSTVDVSIIPLPAANSQAVYEQAVDKFVSSTPDEFDSHLDVGDQGTRVDVAGTSDRPNTTTVLFRVRSYFGMIRFQSPFGVPIRDDLVQSVSQKQADKIDAAG
jgi:hypothetical protein